jgi:hypothetical protein
MKCFEVVQKVLDATYAEIPGDAPTRDAVISSALRTMSDQYKSNLLLSGGPDFSDPATRFAYVFLYVPAHSHWLYELITWSDEARLIFDAKRLRMTCLGGGPGSDLVGVLKYMSRFKKSPAVHCDIVDGCRQWKQTWSDLAYTLDWQTPVYTNYFINRVGDLKVLDDPYSFAKSDLFTMNFFASELYHLGQPATDYLSAALAQAKTGSILLVNDNNLVTCYQWIDGIASSAGFETLRGDTGERKIYDSNERKSALGTYANKFDFNPKLSGRVAWRVFRKS